MTTYDILELNEKLSEVLGSLENGQQVTITFNDKPCAKLIGMSDGEDKKSLSTLKGALTDLPEASFEDFQQIKGAWGPPMQHLAEDNRT